ncbi:glycosyltransferase family 39 protein [Pseudemcibacter aquimaris]|uniref:glycosyltransferase family 39 protein n=1 Tax=Pseudemcibacter aquimaris TaxID=2857064 RepID=UPI0020116DE2|nr:glycosyltransferase family 39 protein [Pseudemcibacter aquimaris]MCC3861261.1 YfhO family protein [Pseudemcibacter aquimaris]WDU58035.1 YfhO family protein [Pseudemcibacter aquimaris]
MKTDFLNHMRSRNNILLLISIAISVALLVVNYDKQWDPPDDGAYGHVADRILKGEVLNLHVSDLHMGYVNFLNAFVLKIFGSSLVNLRLPLVFLTIVQSILVFRILEKHSPEFAFLASTALSASSFILYPNPTANWYALFIAILLIYSLQRIPKENEKRLYIIGVLIMTLFMFRQLTGVITGIGLFTYLLLEQHDQKLPGLNIGAKILTFIMFLGLFWYLGNKTTFFTAIIIGGFQVYILLFMSFLINVDNSKLWKIIKKILVGAIIPLIPIVLYHVLNNSLESWFYDVLILPLGLTELEFIKSIKYLYYYIFAIENLLNGGSLTENINALMWILAILVYPVFGAVVLKYVYSVFKGNKDVHPLPIIALFYGIVSTHYQAPIYFWFSFGLVLCGLIFMILEFPVKIRNSIAAMIVFIVCVNAYFNASASHERNLKEIVLGQKHNIELKYYPKPIGLWLSQKDFEEYKAIMEVTERYSDKEGYIFAFPGNAEIYFISERKNPFRFFSTAFTDINFEKSIEIIQEKKPKVIFYTREDKYNTEYSERMAEYFSLNYKRISDIGNKEVYVYSVAQDIEN